jgi:hypothetical protein
MDTEGMTPHPVFTYYDSLRLVSDEINKAVYGAHTVPTGPSVGWQLAFAEMDDDDAREQAWATGLGFRDADHYHLMTQEMDHWVDMEEQEDLRP